MFNYCILFAGAHLTIVFFPENPPNFPPYFMDKKHIHPGIMPRHAPIWAKTANILALRKACAPHILFRHKKGAGTVFPYARKGLCEGGTFAGSPFASNQGCGSRPLEKSPRSPHPPPQQKRRPKGVFFVVEEDGFEPSKSVTTDLQSAPFGRSGNPPRWSW